MSDLFSNLFGRSRTPAEETAAILLRGVLTGAMLDDFETIECRGKHHGPVLYIEGNFAVMRCSFCELIVKNPLTAHRSTDTQQRSSKTCIQVCDWVPDHGSIKCNSCGYIGPKP